MSYGVPLLSFSFRLLPAWPSPRRVLLQVHGNLAKVFYENPKLIKPRMNHNFN